MALDAGVMAVTLEYAQGLKDSDWFGKQDPYCIINVGGQSFRTRTCVDGGKSPVWNETFRFNVINENNAEVLIKDEDIGRDDVIGTACFSLARAREVGSDRINVAVVRKKSRKQHGFLSISLTWTPNKALHRPAAPQQQSTGPYAYPPPLAAVPYAPAVPFPGHYPMAPPPPPSAQAAPLAPPAGAYYAQSLTGASAPSPYGVAHYGGYPLAPPSGAYPAILMVPYK